MPETLTEFYPDGVALEKDMKSYRVDQKDCKTILFIEDDYVNYLYFKELLKNSNSIYIRTISLSQAINILTNTGMVSLIILSASLSENKNNSVLRQIKSKYKNIPIITIIDDNIQQSDIEYLRTEGDIYINKYTDQDHFMAVMADLLGKIEYSDKFQIR